MKRTGKRKVWDLVMITAACTVALLFGVVIAIPVIVKLELATAAIDYLNRH